MKKIKAIKLSRCLICSSLKILQISGYLTGEFEQQYGNNVAKKIQYILLLDETKKELGRCNVSSKFPSLPGVITRYQERTEFHFLGKINATPTHVNVIIVPVADKVESILEMRIKVDVTDIDSSISPDVLTEVKAVCETGVADKLLKNGHNLQKQGFWSLSVFVYALALQTNENYDNFNDKDLVKIAEGFKRQGLTTLAILLLRSRLPRKIDVSKWEKSGYPHLFDFYCRLQLYTTEVEELCWRELLLNGESYWLHTNLGHLAYYQNNRPAADSHYLTAARFLIAKGAVNFHGNRGVMSWRGLDFVQLLDTFKQEDCLQLLPRQLDTAIDLSAQSKVIHLLACDDQYFQKYGEIAINSSIAHADIDGLVIHLHVINPGNKTIQFISELQKTSTVKIDRTFEFTSSDLCDKAYYTCLRFLIAPVLLRKYKCGVLITEVDAAIIANWSKIMEMLQNKEVCLSNEQIFSRPYPWAAAAALLYFSPSEFAIRMADLIAKYIAVVFDFNAIERGNWVIDQVAIGQSIDFLAMEAGAREKVKYVQLKKILKLANYFEGGKTQFIDQFSEIYKETFNA